MHFSFLLTFILVWWIVFILTLHTIVVQQIGSITTTMWMDMIATVIVNGLL